MELSETQQQVIELGKALVSELALEPGVDTLGRWLAHYIAELICNMEKAEGKEKQELKVRCFEVILILWQHRSFYQHKRPFENFQPIFTALERLEPDSNQSFYIKGLGRQIKAPNQNNNEVNKWIEVLQGVDEVARVLISFCIQQATIQASDDKSIAWLNQSISLLRDDELEVIIKLTRGNQALDEIQNAKTKRSNRIRRLASDIEKINSFIKLNDLVKIELTNELHSLTSSD
jgi:hypothetical protein